MIRILQGIRRFQKHVYPQHRDLFEKLASGQRPEALFITCADSRIDPSLITQTKPGELFICRVIGNIVPPYPDAVGGVSATIEYAAAVLEVPDIIVCGHTDCGVMKGVLDPSASQALPGVSRWLRYGEPALRAVEKSSAHLDGAEFLLALTEQNVLQQIEDLQTHPSVAERFERGEVNLHGWVYHIAEGVVTAYNADQKKFIPLHAATAS